MPQCNNENCPILTWNEVHAHCPKKINGECTNFNGEKLFAGSGKYITAYDLIWSAMNVIDNVEDWLEEVPEELRIKLYYHPILEDFDLLP